MTADTGTMAAPWAEWLRRWDTQQALYIEDRERCFEVMFTFVEALCPPKVTVLDLACGPGAISQRLLGRLPDARSVAVDVDPVLVGLGQGALGDLDGRIRWVRADLRDPGWVASLDQDGFDAVLSTTATHWLLAHELTAVYRDVASILRPGGILLNGDGLYLPRWQTKAKAAIDAVRQRRQDRAAAAGAQDWDQWWDALRAEPSLRETFAERDRIFADRVRSPIGPPTLAFHETALYEAGFEEVTIVWQDLTTRILLALR